MKTAGTHPAELPVLLKKHVTQAVSQRFLEKKKLNAEVRMYILHLLPEHQEVEYRYLCFLANFSAMDEFRGIDAIKRIKLIFKILDGGGGLRQKKSLRAIYGGLHSIMHVEYSPDLMGGLFEHNRTALFADLKAIIKGRLELAHNGKAKNG